MMKPTLQRTFRLLLLACFLLAVLLPHSGAAREMPAQQMPPRYVMIWNSSRTPVRFLLQSGDGAWETYVLAPRKSATYTTNSNESLGFRMATSRSGGGTQEVRYQLEGTKRYKIYYNTSKARLALIEMRPR